MPYFRPDPDRYGGYDKERELKTAKIPPDREPRDPLNDEQTDIRRWITSIDQARRMFGHHRDPDVVPESPPER